MLSSVHLQVLQQFKETNENTQDVQLRFSRPYDLSQDLAEVGVG